MTREECSFQSPKTSHQTTHASELSEDVNFHPQTPKDLKFFSPSNTRYNASPHHNATATASKDANWLDCLPY